MVAMTVPIRFASVRYVSFSRHITYWDHIRVTHLVTALQTLNQMGHSNVCAPIFVFYYKIFLGYGIKPRLEHVY